MFHTKEKPLGSPRGFHLLMKEETGKKFAPNYERVIRGKREMKTFKILDV